MPFPRFTDEEGARREGLPGQIAPGNMSLAVLARELHRASWRREQVAVGTATDPYQPIEGHYQLTRQALVTLARKESDFQLKRMIVERLVNMPKNKAAQDYLMEIIK